MYISGSSSWANSTKVLVMLSNHSASPQFWRAKNLPNKFAPKINLRSKIFQPKILSKYVYFRAFFKYVINNQSINCFPFVLWFIYHKLEKFCFVHLEILVMTSIVLCSKKNYIHFVRLNWIVFFIKIVRYATDFWFFFR